MEPTRPQRQARCPAAAGRTEARPRSNQQPQALSPERDRGPRQLHPAGPCPGRNLVFCVYAGWRGAGLQRSPCSYAAKALEQRLNEYLPAGAG